MPTFPFSSTTITRPAIGVWDKANTSEDSVQSTIVECYKSQGICIAANAIALRILGMPSVTPKLTQYSSTKWDQYELIAEDATADCERDQLQVNRQEKSVTMISTPTYKDKSCKELVGTPETITYHLVDGATIFKHLNIPLRLVLSRQPRAHR